jgi:hypothetical protein
MMVNTLAYVVVRGVVRSSDTIRRSRICLLVFFFMLWWEIDGAVEILLFENEGFFV